jgi:hypothetical protein
MNRTAQDRGFVGLLVGLVTLAILILLPGAASAQEIGGAVTDATGGVLPGVTIEARSPVLIEEVRTAVTDGSGQYLITALQSGSYSVTFTLPGFSTLVREGVELSAGFTANIDGQLTVGSLEETVTVTDASPVVDVQSVAQNASIDREMIDTIPSGKSFQNLGVLVTGMTAGGGLGSFGVDVGGQGGQTQLRLSIHGGEPTDQAIQIDGMGMNQGQRQGDSLMYVAEGNFSEISLDYSASSAEVETGGVRVNMIPKEGGNSFSGGFNTSFATQGLQASNIDDDLVSRGLNPDSENRISEIWRYNPSVGGPIARRKLWFFVSQTTNRADQFVAGLFPDSDPNDLNFTPIDDPDKQTVDDQLMKSQALRLTLQASPRNKFNFYWDNTSQDRDRMLAGIIGGMVKEEASVVRQIRTNLYQATYTGAVSNRLLFEGAVSMFNHVSRSLNHENLDVGLPPALILPAVAFVRGFGGWFPRAPSRQNDQIINVVSKGSMSYVTGSHAFKVGFNWEERDLNFSPISDTNLRYRNYWSSPFYGSIGYYNGAEYMANSSLMETTVSPRSIYAQDKWTLDRLTINAGVRYDYWGAGFPDGEIAPSTYRVDSFVFDGDQPFGFTDLNPRLGVAYDVSGNGRTAIKASLSRYSTQMTNDQVSSLSPTDPASMKRVWHDVNHDGIVQGDPLIIEANGELIRNDGNPAFGLPVITALADPNWAKGFGQRSGNWESSVSVQHELMANMSLNVGYFYRTFVNFNAVDTLALSPEDYDTFSVTVPSDPRLPGGGGNVVSGLYNRTQTSLGRAPNTLRRSVNDFGGQSQNWKGIDVSVNARLENLLLQGGVSTGSTSFDRCALNAALPETAGTGEFCKNSTAYLTQVKLIAAYTLPYDVQVSGTFQSNPGPMRAADVTFNAAQTDIGRALTGGTVEVNVIEPGTEYGERANLFDLRLAKGFDLGPARVRAMFDIFNAFNSNAALIENYDLVPGGTSYLTPTGIVPGRLAKFGFQFDF